MDTSAMREQLHRYLEAANGKKVKAVYIMAEDEIKDQQLNIRKNSMRYSYIVISPQAQS